MLRINKIRNSKFEVRNNNFLAYSSLLVVDCFRFLKKTINYRLSTINYLRGFSFVELLVVIAIFSLIAIVVSTAYLNFEKETKLKNAAEMLKSDLRFAQNKALAGDKSTSKCKNANYNLVGWYVTLDESASSYSINGICKDDLENEDPEASEFKVLNLPSGVRLVDNSANENVRILFRPLISGVTIHRKVFTIPYFYNQSGVIQNQVSQNTDFIVTLSSDSNQYQVIIKPSGDISAKKI